MSLCAHFLDPAQACSCAAGVRYQGLAGGAAHTIVLRLPCFDLSNRRGEDIKHCAKYQPQGENNGPE